MQHLTEAHSEYLQTILSAAQAANAFMSLVYRQGLWLTRKQAIEAVRLGYKFMSWYVACAHAALQRRRARFRITPKFHAFMHIVDYMRHELETNADHILNITVYSTQGDEDFVGKVSLLSCAVSSRAAHTQTLARYALNLWEHWNDFQA